MKTTAILTTLLGLALSSLHAQTVAPFINYQGRVTDSAGVGLGTDAPVNRKVIFRIFDAPSGGDRLWSEQHTVTISNGEFSVLLGNGINANYDGSDETPLKTNTPLDTVFTSPGILRFVEIVVDNADDTLNTADAPISPRQQITSTAYSFRARSADTIASGTDLQLNGSANYGLGYYGATRLFNGAAIDGPVLFGQAGGALGSVNGGTKNIALRWNANGAVGVGSADLSGAAATTKLVLQGNDSNAAPMQLNIRGNSDTNKRLLLGYNTTSNYGSLQAYSGATTTTNLLLNPSGGNVGIGTTNPSQRLDVTGNAQVSGKIMLPSTSAGGAAGLIQLGAARIHNYGNSNFFFGQFAGNFTMTGSSNVGIGLQALINNSTASQNTAIGHYAMESNSTGANNTGIGHGALSDNTSGIENIALGRLAGAQLTTGSYNIAIANSGAAGASNTIWLGTEGTHTKTILAGKVGIGTTTVSPNFTFQIKTNSGGAAWDGGAVFGGNTNAVVMGQLNGVAQLGGHNGALDAWANLSINSGGGNVGIGTSSPTKAKLEINGWSGGGPQLNGYGFLSKTAFGNTTSSSSTGQLSIYASGRIIANDFIAFSDERIKDIQGRSESSKDLQTLLGIEITDYLYKDKLAKGAGTQKKVIAQQVQKVFPQAVSQVTDVVPDIFKKATFKDGWVTLVTDLKKGERVRLIGEKEEAIEEVLEVRDGAFRTAFKPDTEKVFVYGREVKDFRTVDYEAISMLNVSATQQIKKEKDAEVKALQDENSALRARVAALEAKDQARDAKISAIEAMLRSPEKSGAVTVSLKHEAGAE